MNFKEHLLSRGFNNHTKYVDKGSEIVTFPLWTTNGRLVGYQRYDWKADKLKSNDSKGKYYTYRSKEVLTCWGIEHIDLASPEPIFIVEGIWDAISILNLGYRALAVLSNNPSSLKIWFNSLPCKTIAVCDGDSAGTMLRRVCNDSVRLPDKEDCNSMSLNELNEILKEML